jgi:peroxiredoxin
MKKTQIFPVIIILMGAAALVYNLTTGIKKDNRLPVGAHIPEIQIKDVSTQVEIKPVDLKGKVLFVNFWASWCRSCIDEMPYIASLYNVLKENPDFKMLTLVYNDNPQGCLRFVKKMGYNIPVFSDPLGRAAVQFGITAVPETFIVDKTGTIRKVKLGPERWDSQENVELIQSLLKG